jgi:hypothetical protein
VLDFIDRNIIPFFLSLYDAVGYLGVAVAIGLETFVPIIPSEVIVPMAGWKVSQSAANPAVLEPITQAGWNWLVVLLVATLGAVLGSLAGYLIGAWGGRPLLDRWGRYVHIHPADLDRADAWFDRYGDWARVAAVERRAAAGRLPAGCQLSSPVRRGQAVRTGDLRHCGAGHRVDRVALAAPGGEASIIGQLTTHRLGR